MPLQANPTLEGHELALSVRQDVPSSFLAKLRTSYPDLVIKVHETTYPAIPLPPGSYGDTTIICTFDALPKTAAEAPKLELVQLVSSGANHAHGTAAWEGEKVRFCTANGVHAPQMVEWVFATYFSFSHHLPRYTAHQAECSWKPAPVPDEDVEDAVGLRMGILGYGAIGRQCANAAKAFGMDVIVYTLRERATVDARNDDSFVVPGTGDPNGLLPSGWFFGTDKESLNHFLSQDIDVLVICLPFTPLTNQMISKEQLQILSKRKAFISNIGRGQLINQDDLLEALNEGLIKGAALDVTDPEPLPKEHSLWKAKNVFISPHVSWHSTQRPQRVLEVLETNLGRLSRGEALVNRVDKALGF